MSGSWNGEVSVALDSGSVFDIAAALVQQPRSEVTVDEVSDAVCELTNMVGGQVKGLLPGECRMSLPLIRRWREGAPPARTASRTVCAVELSWSSHPLRVTVSQG